jgi:1-acyl-sn-glycerol-3-phosphate acyltransferase
MKFLFVFISVWLISGGFIARNAFRVSKINLASLDLCRRKALKSEWVPFARFEGYGCEFPSKLTIWIKSITVGVLRFWSTLILLLIAGVSSVFLPAPRVALVARWVAKSILTSLGFELIQKGQRAPNNECMCLVANHVSATDILALLALGCRFVANDKVLDLFCIGRAAASIGCIFVSRDSAESREKTKGAITETLKNSKSQDTQLAIFPEGTTTNGKGLITFRRGAFEPRVPVQPVRIHYSNLQATMALLGPMELLCYLSILSPSQIVVHYLPIEVPSEGESPEGLAEKCRRAISAARGDLPPLLLYGAASHRDERDFMLYVNKIIGETEPFQRDIRKSN